MKKLKNELKKIMAFVMFATFVVTMFPTTTALAVEVTDEVNYTQRSIDTTEDESGETEEELGGEEEPETPDEEEKPGEPDGNKDDDGTPDEEVKPGKPDGEEEEPETPDEEEKPQEPDGDKDDSETTPDEEEKPQEPGGDTGDSETPDEEEKPEKPDGDKDDSETPDEEEKPGKPGGDKDDSETTPDEEEKPQKPDGDKDDSETPDEEEKPQEPDEGQNVPAEEKKDEVNFDESKSGNVTGVKETNESNNETPKVQSQVTEQNEEILNEETLKQATNNSTPEQVNKITYKIPKTGDKDSMMLNIAIVIATMSLTAITMLSTYERKKQK